MSVSFSVIVPLYNEQDNVTPLYDAITAALDPLDTDYEMLFVDDGSVDETFTECSRIAGRDPRLRVLKFRTNCGQTPAMAAGLDYATGEVLITMDGDLQNDPLDIPMFLDKIEEGFDIVVGWRHNRQDRLVSRKIPSKIANWIIAKVTGVPIKDNGCSLKAYRAVVIRTIPLYSEMHRFIPAMASLAGPKIAQIKVRHHARRFGQSKYGLSRVYKVLLDLVTIKTIASFSSRPLLWFGMLALPSAFIGVVFALAGILQLIRPEVQSLIPLAGSGLLFLSLTLFLLFGGMLGELIYKTGDTRDHHFSTATAVRQQ